VGRDGRVRSICVCPLGERAGGVEGGEGSRWGAPMMGCTHVVLRGEDARGKTAVVLVRRRLGRASAGPVALSGGIGAVRRRRGGVGR